MEEWCKRTFSVLIDESKDAAKHDEIDFGARSIMTFTKEVIDWIIDCTGAVVISLGADRTSEMSGAYSGVAELLRSEHFEWLT